MKTFLVTLILLANAFAAIGQKSITINVEKLKRPSKILEVNSYQNILQDLIKTDSGFNEPAFDNDRPQPAFNIVAKSNIPDSLVDLGYHPFFEGMYHAYAEHRPFTLSPDMIWLLICQGFSQHVNNNSDSLRHLFVAFKGKISLIVRDDRINLNDPNSPWPEVFPEFSKKINENIGQQLTETLTADFSTTDLTSKVASQITLMDAFKSYFEFMVITIGCGIPEITLEGTTEDWEKVLAKTEALRKYQLDWWVDKMEPLLKKIIAASKGEEDKAFWQGIFKYHSKGPCTGPPVVNGWIVKFFPYDKTGKRNNLDSVSMRGALPNEIVKVDLKYVNHDRLGNDVTTPLELWAGFVGLKQDDETFNLKPEIGWMIRKKGGEDKNKLMAELKEENGIDSAKGNFDPGIMIRVKTIPKELLEIGPIHSLTIFFTDNIEIPEEMSKIKIDKFVVYGKIDENGKIKIRKLFPHTDLVINPY